MIEGEPLHDALLYIGDKKLLVPAYIPRSVLVDIHAHGGLKNWGMGVPVKLDSERRSKLINENEVDDVWVKLEVTRWFGSPN